MKEKRCSHCKRTRPAGAFRHNRRHAGGLHNWCRDCERPLKRVSDAERRRDQAPVNIALMRSWREVEPPAMGSKRSCDACCAEDECYSRVQFVAGFHVACEIPDDRDQMRAVVQHGLDLTGGEG